MRTEGDTRTTSPIKIVHAKVERSLLCLAVGQVTLNVSLTIHRGRRHRAVVGRSKKNASRWLSRMAGVAVAFSMASCGDSSAVGTLAATDLQKPWPLTVESVTLHCVDRNTVNLETNGVQYMLIGDQNANNPHGWKKRTEIWAAHDTVPGLRRDIGELIDVATRKCAEASRPIG